MFWLILYLANPGHGNITIGGQFTSLDDCLKALDKAAIVIPSHNAENEWAGMKACLPVQTAMASYPMLKASIK